MIGDEDLGEDILMRGQQYRFLQGKKKPSNTVNLDVEEDMESEGLPRCKFEDGNLTNGPVDVNCKLPICNGTNGSVEAGTCRKPTNLL
jgi:hypothetical protein